MLVLFYDCINKVFTCCFFVVFVLRIGCHEKNIEAPTLTLLPQGEKRYFCAVVVHLKSGLREF